MRYTGSVNFILWYLLIPLLILFYVCFLFWSDQNYSNNSIKELVSRKVEVTNNHSSIDGVIIGGSNAMFGVSASSLEKFTKLKWINLGIPGEGFSDINYLDFISKTIDPERRNNISYVIYSSSTFFKENLRSELQLDLYGKKKISYKPQRSLASYIKSSLGFNQKREFFLSNTYGDLDFSGYDCEIVPTIEINKQHFLQKEDLEIWLPMQLSRIVNLFPNAEIIITVPNGFYKNNNKRNKILKEINKILSSYESIYGRYIHIESQKPYPSSDLMCVDYWHPNEKGREWRTKQLYNVLADSKKLKDFD